MKEGGVREGGMAAWIISSIAYFFAIVILLIFSIMNVTIIRVIRSIIVINSIYVMTNLRCIVTIVFS